MTTTTPRTAARKSRDFIVATGDDIPCLVYLAQRAPHDPAMTAPRFRRTSLDAIADGAVPDR